jgi:Family of unknown function (DUF6228)
MTSVCIESAEHAAALELSPFSDAFFLANLRSQGASGTARVSTFMCRGVAELFVYFADNWKGWDGKKEWGSLEGELSIAAQSDSLGHVFLEVRLREGAPAIWTLQVKLTLEAGTLTTLAGKMKEFEESVARDE